MLMRTWRNWNLVLYQQGCIIVQPLWKTIWQFLKKLNVELPYDQEILLLGIYSKNLIARTQIFVYQYSVKYYL